MPVSLRSLGAFGDSGNAVGIVPCSLATHLDNPHDRLTEIVGSMNAAKAELATKSTLQITAAHRTDRHRVVAGHARSPARPTSPQCRST